MELCRGEWRPEYLAAPLIPAAFAARVAASPDAPCLVAEDGAVLTFAQVDAAAAALARRLVACGVGPDAAVGILLDRGVAVVVSMIAVHKAGGCYVPLDPNFPGDRLSIYIEDSGALAVISEPRHLQLANSLLASLPSSPAVLLYDDAADTCASAGVALPCPASFDAASLCYIMFTSGSTGRPKGVMVTHGGVRDLVAFNIEHFGLTPADVFCLNSTVGFDSYVTYVFASLAVGGRLVVPGPTAHLDPVGMAQLIATHGITIMECVPALASEYLAAFKAAGDSLACLTRFLTGGEALTPKLAAELYEVLPGLSSGGKKHEGVNNSYGPTEATVTTITGLVKGPFERITMGRPDHNTHTYIVITEEEGEGAQQPRLRLAGVGEPGELWLSGPRLARGYRGRDDLTAKAFVPNPFFEQATAGLPASAECLRSSYATAYRTGDLVQWSPDGCVEFLGRVDRQVKVNGVRMEVGEVENVLAGAPGVTHAAVKPWKDAKGAYRLVGYVAPADVDLGAADAFLRSKLLPAMVPSQLVALPHMPRLPNGKIDVKALEEPAWGPAAGGDAAAGAEGGAVQAPATPLEQLLCDIWSEVLMLSPGQLSVCANFFQLGGSSLRAGLINSKIRRAAGLDISGMLIYQHSNVRDMAAAIERQYGSYTPGGADSSSSSSEETDVVLTIVPAGGKQGGKAAASGAAAAGAAVGKGLPTWLATVLQCAGMVVLGAGAFALFLPMLLGLYWVFGDLNAPLWLLPVISPLLLVFSLLVTVVYAVAVKWVLLGRVRPGAVPIWGWFYVRWWVVRLVVKAALGPLFPLVRATPAINWFYRALGATIGRNVVIDSPNLFDWDMLTIEDNTAIETDAFVVGAHFSAGADASSRGVMDIQATRVGAGCTIMTQTIVSAGTSLAAGTILTPGTTSARPPAGPSDTAAHAAVRTEPGHLPYGLWVVSTCILITVNSLLWLATLPSVTLWVWMNESAFGGDWRPALSESIKCWLRLGATEGVCRELWWTASVALLLLPVSGLLAATLYMWLLVPIKWILVGRLSADKVAAGGLWLRFRRHLWRCLVKGPFTSVVYMWTSTEVYNIWLRALGSKVGRQCWLSEMFRCSEFELYEVEDAASVCSMVTVVGATNGHTARVKLGEACDVTNDCTLLPGCTVGKGAVLGVFTYGAPGQTFADYSITQGEFTLRQGGAGLDVEAGVASGKLESAATRLIPGWQYALYNVLYILGAMTVFATTTSFMVLPVPLLGFAVLYNWGLWASALCLPLYLAAGFGALLAYLTVLKRVVMADTGGQYTIFTSFSAAKWQMLAINAHLYGDFNELKGSVFYNWYLRCMGTRVGRNVCCLGGVVAEYEQVSIGDGAVVGEGSFLLTHTVENRQVKIRPITIAPRVTVGAVCAVLPDAVMEEGSTLADMSLVMKGETVPAGGCWAGLPACAAPKFTL